MAKTFTASRRPAESIIKFRTEVIQPGVGEEDYVVTRHIDLDHEVPFLQGPIETVACDVTHPNEEPAGEEPDALYQVLGQKPVRSRYGKITRRLGNPKAFATLDANGRPRRFVTENIVFATGDPNGNVEQKQMYRLEEDFVRADLFFDRHGNSMPGFDWAFCHMHPTRLVWRTIARLGLKHVVHCEPPHWAGRYKNYLGVDLSPTSPLTAIVLREALANVMKQSDWVTPYRIQSYIQPADCITMAQANKYGLPDTYPPFLSLPRKVCKGLKLPVGTMTLGANNELYGNKTGFWAEIIFPLGNGRVAPV